MDTYQTDWSCAEEETNVRADANQQIREAGPSRLGTLGKTKTKVESPDFMSELLVNSHHALPESSTHTSSCAMAS